MKKLSLLLMKQNMFKMDILNNIFFNSLLFMDKDIKKIYNVKDR